MKFKYGTHWEQYPIEPGEIWSHAASGSMVSVCDITVDFPEYMKQADMVYCDPPWSQGNTNAFLTKAGAGYYIDNFSFFYDAFFDRIIEINPPVCYIEIGAQNRDVFSAKLSCIYPSVQSWEITYYSRHRCYLVRGGLDRTDRDWTGIDEAITPALTIRAERPACVADMCAGQGLTALAAHAEGVRFVGTELNKRRLAVLISRAAKKGFRYEKDPVS